MTTILFYWIIAQGFLGPPQSTEFDDPTACASAFTQIRKAYADGTKDVAGVCAPKALVAPVPVVVKPAEPSVVVPVAPQNCTFVKGKAYCSDPASIDPGFGAPN